MKARRSTTIDHRSLFKYQSPVASKRFTIISAPPLEDQENIAPHCVPILPIAKKRKLYNGQAEPVAPVEPPPPVISCNSPPRPSSNMDMDISPMVTPTRRMVAVEERSTSCIFTPPPNRDTPTNGCYSTPRMSHHTRPKTIQDVFRNVVLYVEVKTLDEDRSESIKAVAKQMGATVNDKLYKNTTHVIFREGSFTTYKKAIKMGVPLVSVTWLEECRKSLSLVDPAGFLPINLEPYERPDLYKRILRKPAALNGEVTTTPERFALKPLTREEELERALQEFQKTKIRLEMDSPTPGTPTSTNNLGRTVLNFSPIGESTKIGAQKTPSAQSNVTPLLRRLMIRNAEEDRRERNHLLVGREKPLPDVEQTKYDRMSMDLSSMWGTGDPEDTSHRRRTLNGSVTMIEDTVDLTENSPTNETKATAAIEPKSKTTSIIQALRRQTMHFTQNASLDISPLAVKENVASTDSPLNDSLEIKVPKICAAPRKSLEDTLRDDILRAKEELLGKAVVINKSDKRRSLLPTSMGNTGAAGGENSVQANKVNRRRTLFNVNDISEGGLTTRESQNGTAKQATKRRTLLPAAATTTTTSNGTKAAPGSPLAVEVKKPKKVVMNPPPVPPVSLGGAKAKVKQSLPGVSQAQRKGTNMGPPAKIPPIATQNGKEKAKAATGNRMVTPTKSKPAVGQVEEGTTKRKLFNSIAELSPVSSPIQSPAVSRISIHKGKPSVAGKARAPVSKNLEQQPEKKSRRSSLDFEESSGSQLGNSSTASSRSTVSSNVGGTTMRNPKNVIVLTNGHSKQLEYIKEVNLC